MQNLHLLIGYLMKPVFSLFPFLKHFFFLHLHILNGAAATVTLILGICRELNTGLYSQTKANARNVTDLQEVINFHEMPCVLTVIA